MTVSIPIKGGSGGGPLNYGSTVYTVTNGGGGGGGGISNLSFRNVAENSLSMVVGGTEMLRVDKDGFYVRGKKIPVDDKEAETVYNAFKQFLVWAELNKR